MHTNCVPSHHSNTIVKFTANTTVVGLSQGVDETMYREEVQRPVAWRSVNSLLLNTSETKEVAMDWRRKRERSSSLLINGDFRQIPVGAHWP